MNLNFLNDYDFFTGVPDSLLQPVCNYLMQRFGVDPAHHVIAANEGNCVALAAGYHLATGKVPVVYLQNSGLGNIINPVASLLNDKVYGIPCVFIVGWRGEPGVHDEPQHIYQGEVTVKLLEDMDIAVQVIDKSTTEEQVAKKLEKWKGLLANGKQVAFVVKKGALEYEGKVEYKNANPLTREQIITLVTQHSGEDPIISTTGKASRELFEIRERGNTGHAHDFLTVGSMGHSSSIAMALAFHKKDKRVWCIDGDGAALMHMGALAVIGASKPDNLIHIVINNGAHESVGGAPTVAANLDISAVARACGYPYAVTVKTEKQLIKELKKAASKGGLRLIEVKCAIGARADLGRPTTTAMENKVNFMNGLNG